MANLTWKQVHSWRMAQQRLQPRADAGQMLEVVRRLGGVQAQLASAAEQALGVRVDGIRPADVQAALWQERSLVKTWTLRGTLHYVTADDLPLLCAARAAFPLKRPPSYYSYHGVTPAQYDAIIDGVARALTDTPQTREQLAVSVAEMAGEPGLQEVLLSGWGALLKPSAYRGDICFGPNQGQNVTFVKPQSWLGAWRTIDPQAAIIEMARRYLSAHGPANPEDFARWFGLQGEANGKKVFRWLAEDLEEVDVEGWKGWLLKADLPALNEIDAPSDRSAGPMVRLLPAFDAFTIGTPRDCEAVLPAKYKARVYRAQGWLSPVALVDGHMVGVWEFNASGGVQVGLFDGGDATLQDGLTAEIARLANFLE